MGGLFSIQPSGYKHPSDDVKDGGNDNPKTQNSISSMTHHLDLVRSGVASIETELQQRASLLAVDNANLRNLLENSSSEMTALRIKAQELESTQHKLGMRFPSYF